jgi:hypothetical protein
MSVGDVLDRNIVFLDSPPTDDDDQWRRTSEYIAQSTRRATHVDGMNDAEVIGMLAGEGGVQIDAVICMLTSVDEPSPVHFTEAQQECLRLISECTNLIPVIGQADRMTNETLSLKKAQISEALRSAKVETYKLANGTIEPLAISSARKDDAEVIDASLLMSSQYLPPLITSELHYLVEHLFDPINMARLRRLSAQSAATYRRAHPSDPQPLLLQHPRHLSPLLHPTSSSLLLLDNDDEGEASKVLVPHSTSSYYRSTSPTISDFSTSASASAPPPSSAYALARYNAIPLNDNGLQPPLREIVTAQWAEDLTRRSPLNPHQPHQYPHNSSFDVPSTSEKEKETSLTLPHHHPQKNQRPSRGRLGGALRVINIDPVDPLGILAFGQRSLFALRIVGGFGVLGALCWCVVRFWSGGFGIEGWIPGWEGKGANANPVNVVAVPPRSGAGMGMGAGLGGGGGGGGGGAWEGVLRAVGLAR